MKPSADDIENIWPLSEVAIGETLKASENGRTIIRIKAKEGDFSYRIADRSKGEDSLRKELLAFSFLPDRGFKAIPKLVKTRNGGFFHGVKDRPACVLQYIEGEHPEPSVETFETLGALTAQLHNIAGYPHASEFDADFIAKNHLKDRAAHLSFKDEYMAVARTLPEFNHFPKALIHTDIGPHNSIRDKKGALYFIDWDDVGMGPAVLDVGFLLIQFFITEDLTVLENEARAFYGAYFSRRPMTIEEKRALFDATVFIGLNYLVFGANPEKRFERLKWSIRNREEIESLYLP